MRTTTPEQHNRDQRLYFETVSKPRMQPVDSPYLNRHVDEAVRFARLTEGERVLEVGCGMGRYTLLLARRGCRPEGLDLSPVLLARLREYDGGRFGIPLHEGDASDPPPELEQSFDAVLGFFTLHHVHDLTSCFRGIQRLLRPGGRVVFLEPNAFNPLYYAQILVTPGMTWKGDRGIVRMRRRTVFDAMRGAGLTNPALARFGFFPPFLANRARGQALERRLERVPFLRPGLPFLLFRAERG